MSTWEVLYEHQRTSYPAAQYRPGEPIRAACLCGWSAPAPKRGDGRRLFAAHQTEMVERDRFARRRPREDTHAHHRV